MSDRRADSSYGSKSCCVSDAAPEAASELIREQICDCDCTCGDGPSWWVDQAPTTAQRRERLRATALDKLERDARVER